MDKREYMKRELFEIGNKLHSDFLIMRGGNERLQFDIFPALVNTRASKSLFFSFCYLPLLFTPLFPLFLIMLSERQQ